MTTWVVYLEDGWNRAIAVRAETREQAISAYNKICGIRATKSDYRVRPAKPSEEEDAFDVPKPTPNPPAKKQRSEEPELLSKKEVDRIHRVSPVEEVEATEQPQPPPEGASSRRSRRPS